MAKQATLPTRTGTAPPGGTGGPSGRARRRVPSLAEYIQESRAELRKVTWPTREETTQLTLAVIAMTLAIAAFLGVIDQILNSLVGPLTGIK